MNQQQAKARLTEMAGMGQFCQRCRGVGKIEDDEVCCGACHGTGSAQKEKP